jgi:tetratricopeptide (TPR) repeat protein
VLLLQQGGAANLERAATLLEDVIARASGSQAVDHLLLARLYERQAQSSDDDATIQARLELAQRELTGLADRAEANPSHLAAIIQFLKRHEKSSEAASWLTKLENRVSSLPKNDPNSVALLLQMQIQLGSVDRSEKWLNKLDEIDSSRMRPLALRAQVAHIRGDVDIESLVEPQANVLSARAKTPEDKYQVYRSLGDLYTAVKKHAAAERWYRRWEVEDAKQYPVVVAALTRQGRLKEAIELCEQKAKTDESVRPALTLATALVEAASIAVNVEYQRAEPMLAAALKKFDSDVNLLYTVALLRVVQGKNAESIDLFRKVVKINPRSIPALNNLAMLLAESPPDHAEALKLIDQAIDIAGKDPGLLDTKGAILVYNGRSSEAIPLLESATRDPRADPRHHFHLALAYRDQGKSEEAKAHLKTALDRQLIAQVLTATDLKLLGDLRTALQL